MNIPTKFSKIADGRLEVWKGIAPCDYAAQIAFINSGVNQKNSKDTPTKLHNPDDKNPPSPFPNVELHQTCAKKISRCQSSLT